MAFLRDLGGGNPLSTPVGQMIEKATDESQASENWGLFMDICDVVSATEDGPKDAMRAIRKRLSTCVGKNYTLVMYTLTLLETCVKNCGHKFHVQLATKDSMQELLRIISPKNDPPTIVQEKVLSLIQTWADAFQGLPQLKEVNRVYQDLKSKGIDFPMTDLDHMAPIHTPAKTATESDHHSPRRTTSSRAGSHTCVPQLPTAVVPPGCVGGTNVSQMSKLRNELDIVERNAAVLSEMLTELSPGKEAPDDRELLTELNQICRAMQQRLMELLGGGQSEDVTVELLRVNDLLNNIFMRYDRYERLRGSSEAATLPIRHPGDGVTAVPPAGAPAVGNLIDLGTEDTPQQQPQGNSDLHLQLANMKLGSGGVSGQLSQLNSTPSGRRAGSGDDMDFDMFAQSRQSFEQNKQTSDNYRNQQADQFSGGLGAAVNARSTEPQTQELTDKVSDYDEMEAWLQQNKDPKVQENTTTSEFNRFLATRAQEGGQLPTTKEDDKKLFSL